MSVSAEKTLEKPTEIKMKNDSCFKIVRNRTGNCSRCYNRIGSCADRLRCSRAHHSHWILFYYMAIFLLLLVFFFGRWVECVCVWTRECLLLRNNHNNNNNIISQKSFRARDELNLNSRSAITTTIPSVPYVWLITANNRHNSKRKSAER